MLYSNRRIKMMEKYLKKSAKQLKQEMLEMTQALEKIRQEKISVYGEIFLDIVEGIDDAKRAEAYYKILAANASKAQKKILSDDIEDLKKLAGIIDEKIEKKISIDLERMDKSDNTTSINKANDGHGINENLSNDVIVNS